MTKKDRNIPGHGVKEEHEVNNRKKKFSIKKYDLKYTKIIKKK